MIKLTPQMRILLCVVPVDFRRGIDGLVRTDLLGSQVLRRLSEVPRILGYLLDVGLDRLRREVANPHVIDHPLTQRCHCGLLPLKCRNALGRAHLAQSAEGVIFPEESHSVSSGSSRRRGTHGWACADGNAPCP